MPFYLAFQMEKNEQMSKLNFVYNSSLIEILSKYY